MKKIFNYLMMAIFAIGITFSNTSAMVDHEMLARQAAQAAAGEIVTLFDTFQASEVPEESPDVAQDALDSFMINIAKLGLDLSEATKTTEKQNFFRAFQFLLNRKVAQLRTEHRGREVTRENKVEIISNLATKYATAQKEKAGSWFSFSRATKQGILAACTLIGIILVADYCGADGQKGIQIHEYLAPYAQATADYLGACKDSIFNWCASKFSNPAAVEVAHDAFLASNQTYHEDLARVAQKPLEYCATRVFEEAKTVLEPAVEVVADTASQVAHDAFLAINQTYSADLAEPLADFATRVVEKAAPSIAEQATTMLETAVEVVADTASHLVADAETVLLRVFDRNIGAEVNITQGQLETAGKLLLSPQDASTTIEVLQRAKATHIIVEPIKNIWGSLRQVHISWGTIR